MDAGEPAGSYRSFPSFLWIIEHVWRHNMMDILQVVGASCWPDLDLQPLSLEESWKLRVASAHVFSVVRSRDVALFERALGFLEATYQLLPGLVAAIKHMKIVFGLKTLVVMARLRDGRGTVDIVSKINQFFPNKLPQYQNRCSQREMFLMRKNHADFKRLAQSLALDKDRLQEYIQSEMEQQYGEHYAQKVEDRLLQYLRKLAAALPGDTHIDKILKKQSPVTEEEKLLLDVITSDCGAVAAALKKLLLCDLTSCRPDRVSQSPEARDVRNPRLSGQVSLQRDSAVRGLGHSAEGGAPVQKRKKKSENIRQFCSKHRRWVRSILQECPDDCANVSSSPPLFPSSSSTSSSSQDLTPSNLVPGPSDRPPPSTVHRACEPGCSRSDCLPYSAVQLVDYKPSPSGAGLTPVCQTSGNEDSTSVQDKTCQDEDIPISDLPPTRHAGSRLSRRFRQTVSRSTSKPSEEFPKDPSRPPSRVDWNLSGPGGRHVPKSTSQSDGPENPGDRLNSGSARRAEPHPEASTTRDGPSPSLLDGVASSSTSKSNQTSPDCDTCCHRRVSSGPSSPPSRQTSEFEDRSDVKRLPDSRESPTSTKLSRKFRQTLKRSRSEPSAEEVLQKPSGFQTGSPPHPDSPSTSQRSGREETSSESAESSPQPSSSRDHLLPAAPSPAVRLVNVSSSSASKHNPTSPDCRIGSQQQEPSGSSLKMPPESQDQLDSSGRLLPTRRSSRQLSAESRGTCAAVKHSKASRRRSSNNKASKYDRSASGSKTSNQHKVTSGSSARTVRPPQPGDHLRPSALMPVVRLVDICSDLNSVSNQVSPCDSVRYSNNRTRSGSGPPPRRTPRERGASPVRLKTHSNVKTRPGSQDRPLTPHEVSKLSSKFRETSSNPTTFQISCPPVEAPQSFCCGNDVRRRSRSTRRLVEASPPLRLSLHTQASLLRSNLLQPYVSVTRLEAEERRPTGASAQPQREEDDDDDDVDSSFDLNELFSDSSGSDGDEEPDPDYKPSLKRKRLVLEYENATTVNKDTTNTRR